jgi:MFS family permease
LFTALTGLAGGFVSLLLIRILFGAGEAGVFPGIARTFAHWMPAHQHGRCFGIAVACGALGGALTQPVAAGLLATLGWRWMFPVFGAVGVVWAVVWLVWFRDDPREHRSVNAAEVAWIGQPAASGHASVPWGALARSRNLWAVCVMYFGIIYGWYFYLTWLPTYLKQARGFDLKAVGWASALPLAGIAAGVFAGGWLSDLLVAHVGRRRARALPGVAGLPLAALAVELASHADTGMQATGWLTAAAGLAALGCAPGWAVCVEIGRSRAGVVSGAMNMCGNLGGALSPLVTGWCLGAGWGWNGPLHTLALGYLLAAVAWCCIDPDKVLE